MEKTKIINFSKQRSGLRIKEGTVTVKNKIVYNNLDPIDLRKLSCLYLSLSSIISVAAVDFMIARGVTIVMEKSNTPIVLILVQKRPSLIKINQYRVSASPSSSKKAITKMIRRRNDILKGLGLRVIKWSWPTPKLLLQEAASVRENYRIMESRHALPYCKKEDLQERGNPLHLVYSWLYGFVLSGIVRLNLDPNIGLIHNDRGFGLVYDISDVFKPLFWDLCYSCQNKPIPIGDLFGLFWQIIKNNNINKELVVLLGAIFRQ